MARFNGAFAEQDAFMPACDAADNHARVLVLDVAAVRANVPRPIVTARNAEQGMRAALIAKPDHDTSLLKWW